MTEPSSAWSERVSPDEEARFARQTDRLAAVHKAKNARWGVGRLLHRKSLLAIRASLDILPNLPPFARHGIFAEAKTYAALVRLSNGGMDVAANSKPDIRGFAIKVEGVSGPGALGGDATSQDFLLINQDRFAAADFDVFVDFIVDASRGTALLLWALFRKFGVGGALERLKDVQATFGRPFAGFAGDTFDSVVPIKVGPYAARVRLTPTSAAPVKGDIAADIAARLASGPLRYDLKLQFFVDDTKTPIEDPTKPWAQSDSPDVTVARLTLTGLAGDVEKLRFDPWGGLEEHRPLGEIMRARKAAYHLSQKGREVV